jgi:hypothetical protein
MAAECSTALQSGIPMNKALLVIAPLAPFGARAAKLPCSIHPKAGIADADLPALAKVTQADAQSTALKAVNVASASVSSSELESEGGCLIYTFDIKLPGKTSIVEVAIDTSTGKLLSKVAEGPKSQAAEAAADLAATKAEKGGFKSEAQHPIQ